MHTLESRQDAQYHFPNKKTCPPYIGTDSKLTSGQSLQENNGLSRPDPESYPQAHTPARKFYVDVLTIYHNRTRVFTINNQR